MRILQQAQRVFLLFNIFVRRTGGLFYVRIFWYGIQRLFLGRMVPLAAMMAVTYRCQCRCVHCAVDKNSVDARQELTTQEIYTCIEGLYRLGVMRIGFTGGEPLLRADIVELVAYAHVRGFSVSIDTNGMLLDEKMVFELKRAGISCINVSIDNPDGDSHDRLRRQSGCFKQAVAGIQACSRAGVPCVVSTYVTRWPRAKIRLLEIIADARLWNASAVRVLFPIYSGELSGKRHHLLSPEDKRDFFQNVASPGFVYSESPLFDYIKQKVACSAKYKLSFYITPEGRVKPCYASAQVFGSLRTEKIVDILKKVRYCERGHVLSLGCEALH